MAISKDQLTISVKIDAKGAVDGIKQVTDELKKTGPAAQESADKITKQEQRKQAEFERTAKQAQRQLNSVAFFAESKAKRIAAVEQAQAEKSAALAELSGQRYLAIQKKYGQLAANAADNFGRAKANITSKWENLKASFSSAKENAVGVAGAYYLIQQALQKLGQAMDATVGESIKLESQTARINTLLSVSERKTLDFAAAIQAQKKAYGTDGAEIAKAYYEAIASGAVDGAGAIELMDTAQKLAIGGVTSLDTAVNALTGAINAYGFAATDAGKISDILFIAAAGGKTDIEALSKQLGDVMAIAKLAGVSFQELAFAVSAVTSSGQTTNVAVTGVRAAIAELLTPSKQLQLALKAVGMENVELAIKSKGVVGVLRELSKTYGGNASALAALFNSVESLPAISALTSTKVGNSFDTMTEKATDSFKKMQSVTDEVAAIMTQTTEQKIKVSHAKIGVFMTDLGNDMKGTYTTIISSFAGLIEKLGEIDKAMKDKFKAAGPIVVNSADSAMKAYHAGLAKLNGPVVGPQVPESMKASLETARTTQVKLEAKAVADAAKAEADATVMRTNVNKKAVDDYVKSFDEMESKTKELARTQKEVGLEGAALAKAQLNLQLEAISKTEKQAASVNLLAGPFVAVFDKARAAANLLYQTILKDDAKKVVKELIKSNQELYLEMLKTSASESTSIDLVAQARLREIAVTEKKQKLLIQANPQIKAQLDATRALIQAEAERAKIALTGITEQQQSDVNKVLEDAHNLMEQNYLSQLKTTELMDYQTDKRLKEIDALEAQLVLQKAITQDEMKRAEIDQALGNIKSSRSDIQQTNEISKARATMQSGGDAGAISESLSKALEPMTAMMSAATSIVSQLQAVVDFLPGFINSVANLLNSITELPIKILESVQALFAAIPKLIAEFIPNILKMISGLIEAIPELLYNGIPTAIEQLTKAIPEIMQSFVSKLPDMVQHMIKMFITSMPRIAIALMKGVFALTVRLPIEFIKAIPSIIKGIINGIIEGIFGLGDMFADLFGGSISKGLESAGDAFVALGTGVSDSLFAVADFAAESKAAENASKFAEQIKEGARQAGNILKKVWDFIVAVFKATFEFIKAGFVWVWELAKKTFAFIVEMLVGAWELAKKAFIWIGELLTGVWNFAKQTFVWIGELLTGVWNFAKVIFEGLVNMFSTMWENVKTIFTAIVEAFVRVWDIAKAIFEAIVGLFKSTWESAKAIFDVVVGLFKGSWDAIKIIFENVISSFKAVWEFVKSLFTGVVDAFKAVFDFVVKVFSDPVKAFKDLFTDLGKIFSNMFEKFGKIFDTMFAGVEKFFAKIGDIFGDAGKKIWEGLKNAFASVGDVFAGLGTKIWDGLKSGFDSVGNMFKKIFSLDGAFGKTDTIEKFLGIDFPWLSFAQGGMVPGQASVIGNSRANDTVPALLSPGEAIIPRSLMNDPSVAKLIEHVLSGKSVQQHSFGGWIGEKWEDAKKGVEVIGDKIAGGASAVGGAISQGAQWAGEKTRQAGIWAGDRIASGAAQASDFISRFDVTKLFNALKRIVKKVDYQDLASNPFTYVPKLIKDAAIDLMSSPFKSGFGGVASRMAEGGLVPGFGNGDTQPAMLTPGEFVMSKRGVAAVGQSTLERINGGSSSSAGNTTSNISVNLTINASEKIDPNFVRDKIMPTIKDELLKRSRRGEYVLAAGGVRS